MLRIGIISKWLKCMGQSSLPDRLLDEIEADFAQTAWLTGRSTLSAPVRTALRRVPRDTFVPDGRRASAWANVALPIGMGQTISQPFIVAIMTELLDLQPTSRVLEVGTGSGYQTAVLAELAEHVYTIELIEALTERAQPILAAAGYVNVSFRTGDGAKGWPEAAPFDAIIVTAAAIATPPLLVDQLRAPGRMIVPVGRPGLEQSLMLLTKDGDGALSQRVALQVVFVPLVNPGNRNSE